MSCCQHTSAISPIDDCGWIPSVSGNSFIRSIPCFPICPSFPCPPFPTPAAPNINIPLPGGSGYLAWNFDPTIASVDISPATGGLQIARFQITSPITVRALDIGIGTAGAGLTAGQNFAGIYNAAGTLIDSTGDISTLLTTAGSRSLPLTAPVTLQPGTYYVGLLLNGTTIPGLWSAPDNYNMLNQTGNSPAFSFAAGPYTTLPTTLPTSLAPAAQAAYFMGLA